MKLHEVLSKFDPKSNLWMRPVSWKGAKAGFIVKKGQVYYVPSLTGGDLGITNSVQYLIEDWELVDSKDILDGK